jgi:FtsH-binding integral membrane protein
MNAAMSMSEPVVYAAPSARVEYLRRVMVLTSAGLAAAAVSGTIGAMVVASVPALQGYWVQLAGILGSYAVAHYVARGMVFGDNKLPGFALASVAEGLSMSWLLLAAVLTSEAVSGNPFLLVSEALTLTTLSGVGMAAYLWSRPRDLSLIAAGMSALSLPMLALMAISFVWPIGGAAGLFMAAGFVVISAAGLLYQLNTVLHELHTDQTVEGAYLVTMGILVLFWNILVLLMRLQDRD